MTFAERLTNAYFHANRASIEHGHGKMVRGRMVGVSKGKFMRDAYPLYEPYEARNKKGEKETRYRLVEGNGRYGRWKNEDSARRAFDKQTSNRGGKGLETSGAKYKKISSAFYGAAHKDTIRGGKLGLWRVDIEYSYVDDSGKSVIEHRSFIMESDEYTSLEDLPYLYAIVPELVDEHMEYWQETGSIWQNYDVIKIEITPIRRSMLTMEYEKERGTWSTRGQGRVNIDELEIE